MSANKNDIELVNSTDTVSKESKADAEGTSDVRKASILEVFSYADSLDCILMVVGLFGGFCTGISFPLFNILFGLMLDKLNSDPDGIVDGVNEIALIFVYVAAGNLFSGFFQVACWSYTGERQTQRLREKYVRAILSQEVGWFDEAGAGELSTKVADYSGKVQDGIGRKVGDLSQYVVQFVGGFCAAFYMSWRLTLVLLAGVPLIGMASTFMITSIAAAKTESFQQYAAAGGLASEVFNGIRTVTALNIQPSVISKYRELVLKARDIGILKGMNVGIGNGGLFGAAFLLYALGFWYGATIVADSMDNDCTHNCPGGGTIISTFFCTIMGAMALGQITPPLTSFMEARVAAAPMLELIARAPLIDSFSKEGFVPVQQAKGEIELSHVEFAYPSRKSVKVCKDYDIKINVGETVAIVGHSGSGKSTIMNLLLRLYDVQKGRVLFDGQDVKDLNIQWLRNQYGYVGQEPVLFSGTIADNILAGVRMVDEFNAGEGDVESTILFDNLSADQRTRLVEAAKLANAYEFISNFPDGFDTDVGSNGTQLSGGQKQRIAIARALARKPAVLLLDEATSALDASSERTVQQALDNLRKLKAQTTIVIAHRLSTIRNADKIAVVNNGVIAEIGTHDELVASAGIYADLVKLQMSGHNEEDYKNMSDSADEGVRQRTVSEDVLLASKGKTDAADSKTSEPTASESVFDKLFKKPTAEQLEEQEKQAALKKRIWGYALENPVWIAVGIFGAAAFGAVFPVWGLMLSLSQDMFYLDDTDEMRDRGAEMAYLYIVLAVASLIGCTMQYYGVAQVGERVMYKLRSEMFVSVIRREIAYFDHEDNSVGAITTRLSEDARLMQRATAETLAKQLQAMFTLIVGVVLGFLAAWKIAFVVVATFPLNIVASSFQMAAMAGEAYEASGKTGAEGALIATAFTNMRTISAFSLQHKVSHIYNQITTKSSDIRADRSWIVGFGFGASNFVLFLTYSMLFWYGATLIDSGEIDFQQMMQAILCLMFGAMGLGQAMVDIVDQKEGLDAACRVFSAIDEAASCPIDALSTKGEQYSSVSGGIELRNINFSYPSRPDVAVCKGYSLAIEPGEVVALVGPSGSGKSTIMNLLLRFYDPKDGQVLLDGHNIQSLNIRWLRNQIGYVGQEPVLFSGTVAENISKGRPQPAADYVLEDPLLASNNKTSNPAVDVEAKGDDTNDIVDAAKVSNAHDFIMGFPEGYKTEVGEGSVMVSGGQKQRIAIARALARKPAVLLLDEATSALDTESERVIQEAIDKLQEKKAQTTIIIAHRLSTIVNSDKIFVFDEGKVVESGKHEELLKLNGLYKKLWQKQTGSA